jgi:hypothetical protein
MVTSKPQKLTREQIRTGLDQVPIETLLSSGKGKSPQLTHKQREFARAIALGSTKAQAYRDVYKETATPATLSGEPYRLAGDPRIAAEVDAYKLALEAEKHRTPAQLKALLVQQLVQHSLDESFPPAQRVQCLKLIGTLFEVGAFVELKQTTTITKSDDIRARLLQVLGGNVQDVTAKDFNAVIDDGASLLAELAEVTPEESGIDDPHAAPPPQNGRLAESAHTHTIPLKQSNEKSDDFDAP